jgi:catecholate siderophore receptor
MAAKQVFSPPAIFIWLVTLLTVSLAAQPQSSPAVTGARLQGTVLDTTRAAIPGAQITITPDDHSSSLLTDSNGAFSFPLRPGRYTLTVTAKGFLKASDAVVLSPNTVASREIVLHIASAGDTVTVTEPADYRAEVINSGTKAATLLRDVPQSVTVVTHELVQDQMMLTMGDVVQYMPGISSHQGENNRDQVVIRGNSSSADFFLDGVRDDVQYYRDLYNLERVEALKGPTAMIFGRGGGGGVINRVSKEANFMPLHEFTLLGGAFGDKRVATDLDQPLGRKFAARLNAMYEDAGSFRDYVNLERYGINPALTMAPGPNTNMTVRFEHFQDHRVADRGISSFQGRPVNVDISTYFGDPADSRVRARVDLGSVSFDHLIGQLSIHNRTLFGGYDRGYQNYVPGAVTSDQSQVSLSAYNNATSRFNVFNQTDLTFHFSMGHIRHIFLVGGEFGRQLTDNFRNTGYFNNTATSILLPLANPVTGIPATFRQSATDADNHVSTNVSAGYFQDQIQLSRYVQLVAGLRLERFDLQYHNNRNGDNLGRTDDLLSPRIGILLKPAAQLSVYANYSVSHLPSSGDQFSSLTTITRQVKPEDFTNYEIGAKWDFGSRLSLTAATYRLNRTNTRSVDPNDLTRILQTGSQRTNGFEFGVDGNVTRNWKVAGGYAWQDAFITSATASARTGAQVAQVPHNTFSIWNHYQFIPRLGAGLGILNRSDMFAAIDDTVVLPGNTRADAAVYVSLNERIRLQANVENLFDTKYYLNADSNTNISPGSSRAVRVGLVARF